MTITKPGDSRFPNAANLFSLDSTTIADSATLVDAAIPVFGTGVQVHAEIYNSGAVTLNAVTVEAQPHPDAAWHTFIDGAEWTDSSNSFVTVMPNETQLPQTLANGTKVHVCFSTGAAYAIRFKCSVAATTTTVSICGSLGQV